ncbi:MAG: PAS domain S-box protein [Acidobacteriota bacterium]
MSEKKDKEEKYLSEIRDLNLKLAGLEKIVLEKNEIEKELRLSESRFRTIFENSPDAIFVEDLSGNVLDVNPAASTLHGIKREKMVGMNVVDLVPPQLREKVSKEITKQGKDGTDRIKSFSWNVNGSSIPVEISIARIEYSQSPAMLLHVRDNSADFFAMENQRKYRETLEDEVKERTKELNSKNILLEKEIIERRKIENTLRESEDRYKKLIEFLPLAIFVYREDKILYLNSMAYKFARTVNRDLTGTSIFKFLHKDYHEIIKKRYDLVMKGEEQPGIEIKIIDIEGNNIDVSLLSCRINYKGKPAVLAVMNDITRKNFLEEQLRHAQKMEAVGRLAGGIAHDFNNLLTVIKGYSEVLLKKINKNDPLYNGAEQIKISSESAESLTNQLLAFSRLQILHPVILNLNELIKNTVKMLKRLLPENIKIKTDLFPGLWNIKVDPVQLEQAIMNLSINAGDAMPEGGTLLIRTENQKIIESIDNSEYKIDHGEYVKLILSDTGSGMEKKIYSKIFEPFFTTKKTGMGTGLGLSMVFGFVKQSNGFISVDSIIKKGTAFEILIPQTKEKISPERKIKENDAGLAGNEKILLVEDNEALRVMIYEMLKMNGYEVITASNGESALVELERGKIKVDLVITDVVMPKMGGHDLEKEVSKKFSGIRFLFMSGYSSDFLGEKGELKGETNFIKKPFTSNVLLRKIRWILDK